MGTQQHEEEGRGREATPEETDPLSLAGAIITPPRHDPDVEQARVLEQAQIFLESHPERWREFSQRIGELVEKHRPAPTERGQHGGRSPIPRNGHALIEDLAHLWDQREALERDELTGRFQAILDRFHDARSLGSYELNRLATRWVNHLASKNRIKMLFEGQAVTIYCADRGEAGFFLPRHAKGKSAAVKGAGAYEFPPLKAIAL